MHSCLYIMQICLSFYKQRSKDKKNSVYPAEQLTIFYVFLYVKHRINVIQHNFQQHKELNRITLTRHSNFPEKQIFPLSTPDKQGGISDTVLNFLRFPYPNSLG